MTNDELVSEAGPFAETCFQTYVKELNVPGDLVPIYRWAFLLGWVTRERVSKRMKDIAESFERN